nr:tribbles homolog 2 [Pogona vitticeps]
MLYAFLTFIHKITGDVFAVEESLGALKGILLRIKLVSVNQWRPFGCFLKAYVGNWQTGKRALSSSQEASLFSTCATLVHKVYDIGCYQELLAPCFCLAPHDNINQITEIILGETKAYVFFERSHGDMHSFVRNCKKLKEEEAAKLFYQIASAVAHCHDGGLVLRDLKLRKFIFKDEDRTRVKLESLEDAYILRGNDDSLSDKHGCPAYVSPEILNTNGSYSGKAADVWSLGVMLYTMLVGRYPFHDIEPSSLFSKIRRGQFSIPETLSPKAKCLIRSILRREPSERLTSHEILDHPWFSTDFNVSNSGYGAKEVTDQLVPDVNMEEDSDPFFN